jgi:hypothetical protein
MEWIVLGAAMAALFAAVGAASWGAARRGSPHQDAVEAAWATAADALGGALVVEGRAALAPRALRLRVPVEEVDVFLEANVPIEAGGPSHTAARCAYALVGGPRFEAAEALFEGRRGSARLRVGVALAAETHQLIAEFPRPIARLSSDGRTVELTWSGAEHQPEILGRAARLVASVARIGVDVLRTLATLEGASYEPRADEHGGDEHGGDEQGPRLRVRRAGVEVTLRARFVEPDVRVLASVPARRALPAFSARIDAEGALEGDVPEGVIDPAVKVELTRVGPSELRSEGEHLVLEWPEPPDVARADAAVKLLAAVSADAGRGGAFR